MISFLAIPGAHYGIQKMPDKPEKTTTEDGTNEWRLKGELHREGGSAVDQPGGSQGWFLNGNQHRLDGPAIEHSDGTKEWWVNGVLHREDGPATIRDGIIW